MNFIKLGFLIKLSEKLEQGSTVEGWQAPELNARNVGLALAGIGATVGSAYLGKKLMDRVFRGVKKKVVKGLKSSFSQSDDMASTFRSAIPKKRKPAPMAIPKKRKPAPMAPPPSSASLGGAPLDDILGNFDMKKMMREARQNAMKKLAPQMAESASKLNKQRVDHIKDMIKHTEDEINILHKGNELSTAKRQLKYQLKGFKSQLDKAIKRHEKKQRKFKNTGIWDDLMD